MGSKLCPHCGDSLVTEHELEIGCCLVCRRYALLRGQWPIQTEERKMSIELTDAQIARLFKLCETVLAIKQSLPAAPRSGADIDLEIAKHLRASLEQNNDTLVELGALLR
jgi:hypothetical protein